MIKRVIISLLLLTNLIYSHITIAIDAKKEHDLQSAINIAYLYNSSDKKRFCFIINSKNPLQELYNKRADFAISDGEKLTQAVDKLQYIRSVAALYKNIIFLIANRKIDKIEEFSKNHKNIYYQKDLNYVVKLLSKKALSRATLYPFEDLSKLKEFDALLLVDIHPSKIVENLLLKYRNLRLLQLESKAINQLIRSSKFLSKKRIENNSYTNQTHDLKTIGYKSILICTQTTNIYKVYDLTTTILKNIDLLKNSYKLFYNLSKKNMLEELIAPQHKGAIKAFNGMSLDEKL